MDDDDDEPPSSFTQSFSEMDKMLNRIVRENGEQSSYPLIKSELNSTIRANITYYESLAKNAENRGFEEMVTNYRLLARVYKELLPRS